MEKNAQACHSSSNAREEYRLPAQFSYDYSSFNYGYPVSPPPPATEASDAAAENLRNSDAAAENLRNSDAAAENLRNSDAAAENLRNSDAAAENLRKSRCPPKVKMVVKYLCEFCLLIILLYLLLVFLDFLNPNSYPPDFLIVSFSISNLTIYENQISANWTIGLFVANPNKRASVSYDDIQVGVAYSKAPDDALSSQEKSHFGFVQKPENQTVIYFELGAWLEGLNNTVANSMTGDVIRDGILDLDIQIQIQLRAINRGWKSNGFYVITITCKGIKVLISPANTPPKNATGHAPEIPVMEIDYLKLSF